ncbi:MAG: hypothetical protein M3441_04235 [Chloroflexota bacterium]|nr:hypothetical protein [Chloroflexota bacterium]
MGKQTFRYFVALVLVILVSFVAVGCGGPNPQPQPPEPQVSVAPSMQAAGQATESAGGEGQSTRLEAAVLAYISRTLSVPYRDINIEVLEEDDAFATVQVRVQLRKSEATDWEEHLALYNLSFVGGEWQVDEAESFVSTLAPQMTATAQAALELTTTLDAVFMLSPTAGFAIGSSSSGETNLDPRAEGTVVLRHKDGQWSQTDFLPDLYLKDLFMVSDEEGWGAGYKLVYQDESRYGYQVMPLVMRYSAGEWREEPLPENSAAGKELRAIYMLSTGEGYAGYAAGERGLLRYQEGRWENEKVGRVEGWYGTHFDIYALQMLPSDEGDEGFAVGNREVLRYSDGEWRPVMGKPGDGLPDNPARDHILHSLSVLPTGEGWAAGAGDTDSLFMRRVGDEWVPQGNMLGESVPESTGGYILRAIELVSPADGWAVGSYYPRDPNDSGNLILHYDGEKWQSVPHPALQGGLNDLDMVSPVEGWAVGWYGTLLHYKDGEWTQYKR